MNSTTFNLFPEISPYRTEMLAVSAKHQIYFEECGNPKGYPVVFLHGGPGSGCNPTQRRFFDPHFYRIILLDQRGCGRSIPPGSIEDNTTDALVKDIETLKKHFESFFKPDMSWENYGEVWNIDHIYPLSKIDWDNTEQINEVCNYKNLIPQYCSINFSKKNKLNFY